MSEETLELVDRANIKHSAYAILQRSLADKGISSYIELIWPLPGETLESYRHGVGELCRASADTMIVYPQLLLHNTPIYRNRERLGVRVRRVPSDVAEADVVVQTKWVNRRDYEDGVWFFYALHSLYNLRGLYHVCTYLDRTGRSSFEETFASAAAFFRERADSEICGFFAESVEDLRNYEFHNFGQVAHMTLHSHREEFDRLLADFVPAQPWWDDPVVRVAFELDLVSRPYIYVEPVRMPVYDFEHLAPRPVGKHTLSVARPALLAEAAGSSLALEGADGAGRLLVEHAPTRKLPVMARRSLNHNLSYCQGMILRLRELLPSYRPAEAGSEREREQLLA
jgi:hypothetical protein